MPRCAASYATTRLLTWRNYSTSLHLDLSHFSQIRVVRWPKHVHDCAVGVNGMSYVDVNAIFTDSPRHGSVSIAVGGGFAITTSTASAAQREGGNSLLLISLDKVDTARLHRSSHTLVDLIRSMMLSSLVYLLYTCDTLSASRYDYAPARLSLPTLPCPLYLIRALQPNSIFDLSACFYLLCFFVSNYENLIPPPCN